ncbi:TrgA family protein [Oceanibium sediminis]|uniref:TrgA family protein n=1 Tax=Oceanibium sediminis TaxID=2026339 RepID=UPI000DD4D1F4|nr:TrgA family protein [Oceanibium sediminis]
MRAKLSQDANMPTAARLVAALALGGACVIMAFAFVYTYPDERWENDLVSMIWSFGICGLIIGWKSLGRRMMIEGGTGIVLGLRAGITVSILILAIVAMYHTWGEILAGRMIGGGAMDAVFETFTKAADYAAFLFHPRILGLAAFLSICAGVMTRNAYFRWN